MDLRNSGGSQGGIVKEENVRAKNGGIPRKLLCFNTQLTLQLPCIVQAT